MDCWIEVAPDTTCALLSMEDRRKMELPEIITRLPEAKLPFPSSMIKGSVVQSEKGQLVFFQILKDMELPAHSHKGQWGTVIEGQIELTIGGETRTYGPG